MFWIISLFGYTFLLFQLNLTGFNKFQLVERDLSHLNIYIEIVKKINRIYKLTHKLTPFMKSWAYVICALIMKKMFGLEFDTIYG